MALINAVESIGNQNNQIKPCRLCLQFNSVRFSTSTSTPTTQRSQLFDSKFPAVFHCQKVTDHFSCIPHLLLLNAESKSSSRTDEIRHYDCDDCHVKFENNTSGRARLGDTALKFSCPGLSIMSPDHLDMGLSSRVPCQHMYRTLKQGSTSERSAQQHSQYQGYFI